MPCSTPFIPPSNRDADMSSGFVVGAGRTSIWADWFFAGNNVPSGIHPDGLITRTNAVARDAAANAAADYAESAFDRMHLGQHDNGQPQTVRPQNTPWWEIRGRLLQEEA